MKKLILGFIIGAILFGGIGIAVAVQSNIASSDISYTNSKNANVTSVKQAVDDLYGKVKEVDGLNQEISDLKIMLNIYQRTISGNICDSLNSSYLVCKVLNQLYSDFTQDYLFLHIGNYPINDSLNKFYDADDRSIRYKGPSAKVNNWICFGSTVTPCPDDSKYRIIGILIDGDLENWTIKVIKATSYTTMAWSTSNSNTWSTSNVRSILNGTYLTSLGSWANKIILQSWRVGGANSSNITGTIPNTSYANEIDSLGGSSKPKSGSKHSYGYYYDNTSKIGLMYVSDFLYAANSDCWTYNAGGDETVDYRACPYVKENWMLDGIVGEQYQWTITRNGDNSTNVYAASYQGQIVNGKQANNSTYLVRPVFYLRYEVEVSSGSGTSSDPWRIKL